jgi:HlyD family secretion protein
MANGKKKKSKKKVLILGGIGVLLLVIILVVAFGGNKELIVQVQLDKVQKRTITQIVTATGKINPDFQVKISAEATGEIVQLNVKEGDKVNKGQLLLRIKPETYLAQKSRAEASLQSIRAGLNVTQANLTQAENDYKRIQGLFDKKLESESNLETAKTRFLVAKGNFESQKASVAQSEASLKEADENLNKTNVYAPMNGIVSSLKVEVAERVLGSGFSPGTELLTVADLSAMEATVDVDENDVVLVSIGDTARIKIDAYSDKLFKGVVSEIANSAKTTGSGTQDQVVNFAIKIRILEKDSPIRPGMSCDVKIETETKKDVWAVPIQSVTARGDKKFEPQQGNNDEPVVKDERIKENKQNIKPKEIVFVVKDNLSKMVDVVTGISDDTYIEIKSGLKGDEEVVSGPYKAISKELENGTKVMLQAKKGPSEKK